MTTLLLRSSVLVVLAAVLAAGGCERTAAAPLTGMPPTTAAGLPIGATCTVQFNRRQLGAQLNAPIPPTTGTWNGAAVCVSGKLVRADASWVVLRQDKKQLWIPRGAVLLLEVQ